MSSTASAALAWARRKELREELAALHQRRIAAVRVAQRLRQESREIVARCHEGRIGRENDRER